MEVTVTDDVLTLKGRSKHGFRGHLEHYRLPERAQPEKATASCVHGVLTVRMPVAPEENVKLAVSTDASKLAQGGEDARTHLLLEEAALPGFSASDITATVRGRTLHLCAAKIDAEGGVARKRVIRRSVLLPAGAPGSAVSLVCANGVLRATIPRAALATAATTAVAISEAAAVELLPPTAAEPPKKDDAAGGAGAAA